MITKSAFALLGAAMLTMSLQASAQAGPQAAEETAAKAAPAPTPGAGGSGNRCPMPKWPKASLRNGEQGTVKMRFLIGTDGNVMQTEVSQSSGFPMLDKAAVEGLSACTFKPAAKDGVPEQAWKEMSYVWSYR